MDLVMAEQENSVTAVFCLQEFPVKSSSRSSVSKFGCRLLVRVYSVSRPTGRESLALVLIVLVALTPCVAVVWLLALHVFHPSLRIKLETRSSSLGPSHNDRLGRQSIFALSTVLLFFVIKYLDDCVTKKDPRSDFFVWRFDVAKRFPPVPDYIASVALHLFFSAIAAFFFSAFFTAFFTAVPIWILIFFLDMSLYISWYILLPLVLFSLFLLLSLSRRIMHSYLAKRRSGSESIGRNVRDA